MNSPYWEESFRNKAAVGAAEAAAANVAMDSW